MLIASSFDKSGLSYGHNYEEHMYQVNTLFHDQEIQQLLDEKKVFIAKDCSHHYMTDHYMSPTYHLKEVRTHIYTTEDLSFQKPDKKYYSKKKIMLKNGTAWYDDDNILVCDKAIPVDTDEVLAVSVNIIKAGILNDGYKIVEYNGHFPYQNSNKGFWRILIQKAK